MIRFCFDCRTHFCADPEQHEKIYHPDGEWIYANRSAAPKEQFPDS